MKQYEGGYMGWYVLHEKWTKRNVYKGCDAASSDTQNMYKFFHGMQQRKKVEF